MKAWKVALVAAAALAGPLSGAAADGAPRETRLTFIDPEVVSQLPSDLQERMVAQRDDSVFFVHESQQVPPGPAIPQRARFREVTPVTASAPAPTPVVAREPAEEARRPTPRSAADDARRRRDYEAWAMRREALEGAAPQGAAPALATNEPRFAEVAAPQPEAEAPADEDRADDDADSDSDYTTPAQAQLDAARRARRALEARQRAEAASRAAAEKLRFAESRRPVVRAFPAAENGRGTYDLAGHIIASRAQRAAARRNMRDALSGDEAAPQAQDAEQQLAPAFIEVAEQDGDGDGDGAEPLAPALHVRSLAEVMEMRRAHFVRGKPAGNPEEPKFEPSPAALLERENELKQAAQIPESAYTPPHGV